ncbi:hypothetical protein KBZ33_08790 [Cyanobium sp. Cruz-8D1]|uniref:hypothetical protein n=1 Tax=Cyanobium sp. Cruz-8D1 TaxID=2823711 RepID=UPI0020CCF101|nr:hypothetical protein [Cyanobium sp. Cruz-8D1]MCP9859211.1 hypothetical protein [Cyanobium sp. Cruz-8H5]MCP9866396.1 hypothetical protein [Cyanobium sp. Cruz-8D1]
MNHLLPGGRRRFVKVKAFHFRGLKSGLLLIFASALVVSAATLAAAAPDVPPAASLTLNAHDQYILRYVIYFSVLLGGALGGLIYSLSRHRGFIVPHWVSQAAETQDYPAGQDTDGSVRPARRGAAQAQQAFTKLDLGTLADCVVGIGGGIIIFNLVPQAGDSDLFMSLLNQPASLGTAVSTVMKILALALIGGFAGISLFDEAAKRISRQLEDTQAELHLNRDKIQVLQNNDQQESDIQFLLSPLVDPSLQPLTDTQNESFHAHVLQAPLNIRNKVFNRLQKAHDSHLITGGDTGPLADVEIETRMTLQQGLLAGFDALIAAAKQQTGFGGEDDAFLHRYLAHRGFIHLQLGAGTERLGGLAGKPSQHWREAEESLTLAIDLRDRSAADRQMFWHYSLKRMLARFKLGITDLIEAEINQPEVMQWLKKSRGTVHPILKSLPDDFFTYLRGLFPALFEGEEATPLQRIQRAGAL